MYVDLSDNQSNLALKGLEAGRCVLCAGASRGGRFGGLFIPPSIYGGHSPDACLLKRDQQ